MVEHMAQKYSLDFKLFRENITSSENGSNKLFDLDLKMVYFKVKLNLHLRNR